MTFFFSRHPFLRFSALAYFPILQMMTPIPIILFLHTIHPYIYTHMLLSRFYILLCALVTVDTAYTIYFFLIHHCTNGLSSLHIFVHHCTFCASLHTKTSPARLDKSKPERSLANGLHVDKRLQKSIYLSHRACLINKGRPIGYSNRLFWSPHHRHPQYLLLLDIALRVLRSHGPQPNELHLVSNLQFIGVNPGGLGGRDPPEFGQGGR